MKAAGNEILHECPRLAHVLQATHPAVANHSAQGEPIVKLLLISDDGALKKALPDDLRERGFTIDTAHSQIGNRRGRTGKHEAIVLDIESASDTKLSWIGAWRRRGIGAKVLILLPATIEPQERVRCLELGADDFLTKPFETDELEARLLAFRRRRNGDATEVYRIHDMEIDPSRATVRRDGKAISLTAREFELLQYLIEHRGQIVRRREILDHLYRHLRDPRQSNVVDVYISYLRRKLDRDSKRPLIVTRWGEGYEFLDENAQT